MAWELDVMPSQEFTDWQAYYQIRMEEAAERQHLQG